MNGSDSPLGKRKSDDSALDDSPRRFKHWGGVLSVLESECNDDSISKTKLSAVSQLMSDLDATTTLIEVVEVLRSRQYDDEKLEPSGPRAWTWWNSVNSPLLEELIRAYVAVTRYQSRGICSWLRGTSVCPDPRIDLLNHCVYWHYNHAIEFLLRRVALEETSTNELPVKMAAAGTRIDLFELAIAKTHLRAGVWPEILAQEKCTYEIACVTIDRVKKADATRNQFLLSHASQLRASASPVLLQFIRRNELAFDLLLERRRQLRLFYDLFFKGLFHHLVQDGARVGLSADRIDDLASIFLDLAVRERDADLVEFCLSAGRHLLFKDFDRVPAAYGNAVAKHFVLVDRAQPIQAFQNTAFVRGLFSRIVEDYTDYRGTLLAAWFARGYPLPGRPIQLILSISAYMNGWDAWPVCRFVFKNYNYKLTTHDMQSITPRLSKRIARLLHREHERQRACAST